MEQPGFFEPIKSASKKDILFWLVVIVMMTLKINEGDQSFFTKHFGDMFESGPVLDWYKWAWHFGSTFILFALVPVVLLSRTLGLDLKDIGLTIGDWKFGLKATAISMIVMLVPVYISSHDPQHMAFYPLTSLATASAGMFALWGLTYLPHYIGWEVFFRGYIGMGLRPKFGAVFATGVQVVLTTIMHIGKPEGETWSAVIGGVYLGLLTYRTGSVLWAILFHFYLGMLNTYMCG